MDKEKMDASRKRRIQQTIKRKQKMLRKKRRQTRIIYATLAGSLLASLIWLIALCTNGWVELILPEPGVFLPSLQDDILGRPVLVEKIWTSVWHVCRVESANDTRHDADATFSTDAERPKHRVEFCTRLSFYPSSEELATRGLDSSLLDFRRAITSMGIIGLGVAVAANAFTVYAVHQPRYVLRRLAGCLQLGAAVCLLVCVELFEGGLSYTQGTLPAIYPPATLYHVYGYSFILAWISFALFVIAGVVQLIYSRKEKTTDTDQPVILGRL